jgi:hypothetical protein
VLVDAAAPVLGQDNCVTYTKPGSNAG